MEARILTVTLLALAVGCAKGAPELFSSDGGAHDASVPLADGGAEPQDALAEDDSSATPGTTSDAGCNELTCKTGCCSGDLCVPGTSDTTCGTFGTNCLNCALGNQACKAGACVAAACVGCTTGCCQGSSCELGMSDQACGAKGALCINCSSRNQACVNGLCM
jgi:hypothetical protein